MSHEQAFANLVTAHAIKAGYDISSPRSGGKTALAADTGMSASTVGRMLTGKTIPTAYAFEALSEAIHVPVAHLLETAGIVSVGALTGDRSPETQVATAAQVAPGLGITSPLHVALLEAITNALLQHEEESP